MPKTCQKNPNTVVCGNNIIEGDEVCDGFNATACSSNEECKPDCSGCVASCSSSPQCKKENGEWGYGPEYFCNIDGDGVLCSQEGSCYVLTNPTLYPIHDCTSDQICSEGECYQCTQEDTSKCTSGEVCFNTQCCTPSTTTCDNLGTYACGSLNRGCGITENCGSCSTFGDNYACNQNTNLCECTPLNLGYECGGDFSDGCGETLHFGDADGGCSDFGDNS